MTFQRKRKENFQYDIELFCGEKKLIDRRKKNGKKKQQFEFIYD